MPDASILTDLLQRMEIAILQRTAPNRYKTLGKLPEFYSRMFPCACDGSPCTEPWKHSFMLESFFNEAELFFNSSETSPVNSGFWEEDLPGIENTPLFALALKIDDRKLIIIRSVQEYHSEKVKLLGKARKQLIEWRKLNRELAFFKSKSFVDPLTTMYNRAMFLETLKKELNSAGKRKLNLSLIMFDIDDFKQINDEHGHLKGDSVLSKLGTLVKSCLRDNDLAIRYGGDELCILSRDINLKQAESLAGKVLNLVGNYNFDIGRALTVSIGLTMHKSGDTCDSLIARADEALYAAKRNGKNQVQINV